MPSFENKLRDLNHQGQIIVDGQAFSVEQLLGQALSIRNSLPQLSAQKVAVVYCDMLSFTLALLAFDGFCASLYLCSTDTSKSLDSDWYRWTKNAETKQASPEPNQLAVSQNVSHNIASKWYLASSGTSGQPKWFPHTLSELTRHIKVSERLQSLCWANLYEPHRFAGLQVLLQALLSGAKIVDVNCQDPVQQVQQYALFNVSALSATPSKWRQLLMSGQLSTLALTHITLGGEIADQALLDCLSEQFPQANIRHIYASTEAGVGFVVSDHKAGFPKCWLKEGVNGAQLSIDNNNQQLHIKSAREFDKTLADRIDQNGFLDTQDKVQLVGDRVMFLGRASGVINVGGEKVFPEKVESVLLQVGSVQQVRVYAKNNPIMGALVAADVVIMDSADWSTVVRNIRKACKLTLQRFEIPVKLVQVKAIEVNASGKLSRR